MEVQIASPHSRWVMRNHVDRVDLSTVVWRDRYSLPFTTIEVYLSTKALHTSFRRPDTKENTSSSSIISHFFIVVKEKWQREDSNKVRRINNGM